MSLIPPSLLRMGRRRKSRPQKIGGLKCFREDCIFEFGQGAHSQSSREAFFEQQSFHPGRHEQWNSRLLPILLYHFHHCVSVIPMPDHTQIGGPNHQDTIAKQHSCMRRQNQKVERLRCPPYLERIHLRLPQVPLQFGVPFVPE